jgi:TRAP transporter, 4TM/12TM fusion protein
MQTQDVGARPGWVLILCAAITVGIHVWLIFTSLVPNLVSRPLHFAAALPWVFLFVQARNGVERWIGFAATAFGLFGAAYLVINRREVLDQYGALDGSLWQFVLAFGLIAVALEMARRAVQPVLPGVALVCLLYGFFGEHLPGTLGHPGLPLDYFLGSLVMAEGGLWGQLTGISIDLIVPFMILGAVVSAGEAGRGFMAMASQLAGGYRAGAAKVSVLASALYGTISGSASANVASVGAVTIPGMIRMGYPRSFAAAVEAVASTGGQIMPPVMGSAAFVMAELIRAPYADIAIASILPAILFFFAAWVGVHYFALRFGLKGLPAEELPGWRVAAATAPFFATPLFVLIAMLLVLAYSPAYSAMVATAVTVAMLIWNGQAKRFSLPLFIERMMIAVVDAARQIALIAAIIICAGLIVGVFHATGLGVKITGLILDLSGGASLGGSGADRAGLHHPRHGAADDGRVSDLCRSGRTGAGQAWPAGTAHAHVRFLVCAALHDHAASLRNGLRCRQHRRHALAAGGRNGDAHRPGPVPDPARVRRQSGTHADCYRARFGNPRDREDWRSIDADLPRVDQQHQCLVAPGSSLRGRPGAAIPVRRRLKPVLKLLWRDPHQLFAKILAA